MEEKRVYIRIFCPTEWSRVTQVIDAENGDIILEKRDDDIALALQKTGRAIAQMEIRQSCMDDGRICTAVSGEDGYILSTWRSDAAPRRRGGRKSYVKLLGAMLAQPRELQQALLALANNITVGGKLTDEKRRRALTAEQIFAVWGCSRTKGYELMKRLKDVGAIEKNDGAYFISRDYLARG